MTRLTVTQARKMGLLGEKPKKKRSPRTTKAILEAKRIENGVLLIIPENMPSLNVWKNWHWTKQARYKKYLTEIMADLTLIVGRTQYVKARVEITHYHPVIRNRDSGDNYCPKFVLDSLRYAGFIQEDHSGALQVPEPELLIDRLAWRTEIKITELEGE